MEARIPMIARTTNSSIRLNPRLGMDPVYAIACVPVTLNLIPSTSSSRASPPSPLHLHLLVSALSSGTSPLRLLRHLVSSPISPLGLLLYALSRFICLSPSPLRPLVCGLSSPPPPLGLYFRPLLSTSSLGLLSRPLRSAHSFGLFFRPVLSARPLGFTEPCVSPDFLRHLRFGIGEPTQKIKSEQSASGIVPRQHRSRVLMDDLWWSRIRLFV